MFNQPLIALPLLGLAAALAWTLSQPGLAPAVAALACALALVWGQRHATERQRDALAGRVAALEQRCRTQEAELSQAERQPGRSLGMGPRERRRPALATLEEHARLRGPRGFRRPRRVARTDPRG